MPAPKGHVAYPGCETGGRPIKYTLEYIENEADMFLEWMKREDSLYYKEFCLERGYNPKRLLEFSEVSEKFSHVYEQSKVWQETRISKKALNNEINSGFSKFFMSNVCGWSEKQETKLSGDSANPLSFVLGLDNPQAKELISMVEEQQIPYNTDTETVNVTE
jgi:hypothetical protein